MEALLLQRSCLSEAGVTGEAMLEGAAAGTSLALPYCTYLVAALLEAATTAGDESIEQPHLNLCTIFCETWHEASLARLSDADTANACRLADYLMLDHVCIRYLEDVAVQREARSNIGSQLLIGPLINRVGVRIKEIKSHMEYYQPWESAVARGLVVPTTLAVALHLAGQWGHTTFIQQARAAGMASNASACSGAARGGHLRLLQQLHQAGFPWDAHVINLACMCKHEKLAIWAFEHGAPVDPYWYDIAAVCGCLKALNWAHTHGRLSTSNLVRLRERCHRVDVQAWLDTLPATT